MKNKDNFVVILDEITVPCTRDEDKRIYWEGVRALAQLIRNDIEDHDQHAPKKIDQKLLRESKLKHAAIGTEVGVEVDDKSKALHGKDAAHA